MNRPTPSFLRMVEGLHADPAVAIVEFSERVEAWLRNDEQDDDAQTALFIRRFYERFIPRHNLALKISQKRDFEAFFEEQAEFVEKFRERSLGHYMDVFVDDLISDHDRRGMAGAAHGHFILSREDRPALVAQINKVSAAVNTLGIEPGRLELIFGLLTRLTADCERPHVPTDRFFVFFLEACFAAARSATDGSAFMNEVRALADLILRARSRTEGIDLPRRQLSSILPARFKPENS